MTNAVGRAEQLGQYHRAYPDPSGKCHPGEDRRPDRREIDLRQQQPSGEAIDLCHLDNPLVDGDDSLYCAHIDDWGDDHNDHENHLGAPHSEPEHRQDRDDNRG